MKANKRAFRMTLGLILAAVLLICQVISVSAEEPAGNLFRLSDDVSLAYENRSDGTCAITGYQGTPATLEIPDIIEGMKVTEIAKGAFMNCESLKSVHIPESVEIISNIAFAMCPSLMELTFGSELKEIGQGAFAQCGKLEQVVLPDTVCSIGKAAFGGCASLVSIRFPKDLERLEEGVMMECSLLTEVILPEKLRCIEACDFYRCEKLTELALPETLEEIGNSAFFCCTGLKEINIPQSLTIIGEQNPFTACFSLQPKISETHPAFEIKNNALFGKKDHRLIAYLPGAENAATYDVPAGTEVIGGDAFYYSDFLTEMKLPEGVRRIGQDAFGNCSAMKSIEIPASVEEITGNPFPDCTGLTGIEVSEGNKTFMSIDGVL